MKIIYSEELSEVLKKINDVQADIITENADSYLIYDDSPLNHFEEGFELCIKAIKLNKNVYASAIHRKDCVIFIIADNEIDAVNKVVNWIDNS